MCPCLQQRNSARLHVCSQTAASLCLSCGPTAQAWLGGDGPSAPLIRPVLVFAGKLAPPLPRGLCCVQELDVKKNNNNLKLEAVTASSYETVDALFSSLTTLKIKFDQID